MTSDQEFEQRLQALLDGRSIHVGGDTSDPQASDVTKLQLLDIIARAHRTAIFGRDVPLDRAVAARWGHLEIRGEIGRGASGTVYRAWDSRLARQVALKLLASDTERGHDMLEEGRLLARLNHPHIVRVFGADVHDGIAGIWMELLEGSTLDEILARDGPFGEAQAALIGLDLAGAIGSVHAASLLHRDIKGRNVLRERGGRIVLMDLGAGRPVDTLRAGADVTGTPLYMAPEVLVGGGASARSDLYSLGVLLYRLLTGTYPVVAESLGRLRAAHDCGARVPLASARPDVSGEIAIVIERACDPDPGMRYHSVAEFESALSDGVQRALVTRACVPTRTRRHWARWRRTALVVVAAISGILLATWASWNSATGRSARRLIGLRVAPRSPLYVAMNGGLGIIRGTTMTLAPFNPTSASCIAVSSDLGVRTMAALSPWTAGAAFRLDGVAVAGPTVINEGTCCWGDGTTDGQFNYAVRQDSTLLETIGSRPLAPTIVYRFARDWSNPQRLFPVSAVGTYGGLTFSGGTNSFWLTRKIGADSVIEEWSRAGDLLGTPIRLPTAELRAIAVDPMDGTLWAIRYQGLVASTRLENFEVSGRHLGSLDVERPHEYLDSGGAEFAWPARR